MKQNFLAAWLHALALTAAAVVGLMALCTLPAEAAEAAEVSIVKMQFEPQTLVVKAGSTVRWSNREKRNNHSILFAQEGGLESERLFPGESWQRKFERPGSYAYSCGPHPEMTGAIVVE